MSAGWSFDSIVYCMQLFCKTRNVEGVKLISVQVGEAIPVSDASVDAVVGTLVLCSVKDVDMTLQGK